MQVSLGEDLSAALADGVVLCHIANHVSPRAVSSIHVPSPAVVGFTNIFLYYNAVNISLTNGSKIFSVLAKVDGSKVS